MNRMIEQGVGAADATAPRTMTPHLQERSAPSALAEILSVIRRRRTLIAVIISALLVVGLLFSLLATRKYTASAVLEIQRETGSFVKVEGATSSDNIADQEFYQTQYGLLSSKSLAERVANDLALYSNTDFLKAAGIIEDDDAATPTTAISAQDRRNRTSAAAAYLLARFKVEPERFSRLVTIEFTGTDPALTKRVIDTWSTDFIRMTLARRYDATSYARNFLEQRLVQLRSRINDSERQLVDYASRQGIVNLPASTTGGERSIVAEDLANTNGELGRAVADRVRAQSRLNNGGAVDEALGNSTINSLRQRRAEQASDYAKMMAQFEPGYPPARALRQQMAQVDRSIAQEVSRVQRTLQESFASAERRETEFQQRMKTLKSGVLDFRRRSIQYNILQREVDTNRQLYDALLQRYKEIGVAGGVGVNNISVVDTAELPTRPSSPKLLLNMAIALVLGIGLSALAAFLLEQIDQGITDPGQVEGALGVPLLGTTPKLAGDPVTLLGDRKTAISEAYLSVQTNLGFSTHRGFPASLAVTSSRAAEGKSTTAFAIAQSLGRTKRRVLLVDADMRSPSVHHLLSLANDRGFSNYLTGEEDLDNLIVRAPNEPMAIMTAGPQPPSAPELLSGDRFRTLIGELLARYDHVVFDIPPVMGLADAPLIASAVEGVVFVIEASGTHVSMAKVALGRLQNANARIFGTVLTKFDTKRGLFGSGYEYGYGYGYGDTAKKPA
ncbi:capsular exopolysaccharide synthesis family protein [Sphingomonas aurantiaca]|uniref:non-specific protein-tyrosine kinase n=1 Tax=Sphingomonas aurantiaca TaxID=185949 RepID=A0A2T5GG37_9SPHN|nr:polysaccharide biosynthesis tyrosine autokinase [Sphingomonas aurantiaca]PTQ58292.1 capsular exopolysaccharide synthesis family protein [Sphingomonas aurantiaca]